MDSLELNKAFAAVLLAGIAFTGANLISNVLVHPVALKQTAIKIDEPAGAAVASAAPPEQPIAALLVSADPARGEAQTKAQGCVACHSFNEGGKAGIGPNLYGVLGEPIGVKEGYTFSAALQAKGPGPWTYDKLNEWLTKPAAFAPGTKMTYAGLTDPKKRADVIDYLRSLSATPEPLPPAPKQEASATTTSGAPGPAAAAPAAPAADQSIEARLVSADPKAGQADTMKLGCVACHSFNEGGKAGIGPNLYGVVGEPIGVKDGYTFSTALASKGPGPWTYDQLDKWLTKPAAFAPGTKMTFAGVTDPKQRADVIDYLRTLSATPEPLPAAK